MVFIHPFTCVVCETRVSEPLVDGHRQRVCTRCRRIDEDARRDEALTKLRALPLDDRIARIEKWIYDHSTNDINAINGKFG